MKAPERVFRVLLFLLAGELKAAAGVRRRGTRQLSTQNSLNYLRALLHHLCFPATCFFLSH